MGERNPELPYARGLMGAEYAALRTAGCGMPTERVSRVWVGKVGTRVRQQGDLTRDEAVVFVHGNPGPSDDWEGLMPHAARLTRAVSLDLPGFGLADRPVDFPYTVEGYAAFLGGVVDSLGVRRVHLVMHDFGGAFGLRWAAEHPARIASFTLINTGVMFDYQWHLLARVCQTPWLGELALSGMRGWPLRFLLNLLNPRPLPHTFTERMARYADVGQRRAVLNLYRNCRDLQSTMPSWIYTAGPVWVPTLVAWGARDPFLPVRYAHRQREVFAAAEVHVLSDTGHWPYIDDPDSVVDCLLPFLARHVRSRGGTPPARASR